MVSTYLSFDLVNRDLSASLKRVSKESLVARDSQYYKENIGKVKTVDEFLGDYRLYSYAMKAFGLEDMTYAKAFMKKVLESDLSDDNSFANRLSDKRYRDFAGAFNFTSGAKAAQTATQSNALVDLYDQTMVKQGNAATTEMTYFKTMMKEVKSADELLNNDRLRSFLLTSYGIDERYYSRDLLHGALSSDTSDPDSYINKQLKPQRDDLTAKLADANARLAAATSQAQKDAITLEINGYDSKLTAVQKYFDMANAFNFNADGTTPPGGAQTDAQNVMIDSLYLAKQKRLSAATAENETGYFKEKLASITNVTDITSDSRLYDYVRRAFNLTDITVVRSTVEQILTSDLNDPNSYVNRFKVAHPQYLELAKAFSFKTDGTVEAGKAQTAEQTTTTTNFYSSRYDDEQEAADTKAANLYKTAIAGIKTVNDFINKKDIYEFALKAVGLDPSEVSKTTVAQALKSDINDPNSFVNSLKDERYVTLVKAFNFGKDGLPTDPMIAQSRATITSIASSYTVMMTRFVAADKLEQVKKQAKDEVAYYTDKMQKIQTADEFINDPKLVNIVLTSYGIDPKTVKKDFLKQVFASDLKDPNSFVNKQTNTVWAEILGTFNFDKSGHLSKEMSGGTQSRGKIIETENKFTRQTLEEEQGAENAGVRLALYFKRMAGRITSAYDILGDTALQEFFRVNFQLPDSFSNLNVDKQAALVKKYMNLEDLKDPEKVDKMVKRFTAMYDLKNSSSSSATALSLLTNSNGNAGISADLLYNLSRK
ncbi:DUF1217 domain-containing protein [Rhizobium sp. SSA_523]|uniref:DUF1217 domain-containing protein n=1 Tax=Rhizobium sp. SSA_523 TaxID=2952477 RepID=UPI002091CB21|nr:DUF1217 domain-containing protein [Rhizobium sp. SSA_523]MCO5731090.1 DUF1217 domain-containing protein [Rhizobium sp. SSA_523]WKC24110.1 DUF1217 domain-containing protein [Rhizobium sp. SSA_523]